MAVSFHIVLALHCLASFSMFGVIWIVQLVHYPLFMYVDQTSFQKFEKIHVNRIAFIVIPLMLTEFLSGIYLWYLTHDHLYAYNFFIIILIWLSTAFLSIPYHNKLIKQKSKMAIKGLINTNWIRTTLWSIKALILFYILVGRK